MIGLANVGYHKFESTDSDSQGISVVGLKTKETSLLLYWIPVQKKATIATVCESRPTYRHTMPEQAKFELGNIYHK